MCIRDRVLESEREQLLLQLNDLGVQLGAAHTAKIVGSRGLRHHISPASRLMKRALNGSLWMARRSASRATSSSTPESSKSTRPGLMLAIHHSGEPLPEPMRVSAGFFVIGRSGKMLIQTLPPRLMWRVIAIRAASIWRLVTYAGVIAWMPYSPNETLVPPVAWPVRPGWCCLRCLTLRGISIIMPQLLLQPCLLYTSDAADDLTRVD